MVNRGIMPVCSLKVVVVLAKILPKDLEVGIALSLIELVDVHAVVKSQGINIF